MRKIIILCFWMSALVIRSQGNLTFVGHATYDGKPLINAKIKVMESGKEIQSISADDTPDFKVSLPFGKNYRVYFEHPRTQRMFMEIYTDNVPDKKRDYKMTYELTIPFFPKDATSFDTIQFRNPFHKVVYDGKNGMKDDTLYMNSFLAKVQKKKKADESATEVKAPVSVKWTNLAGKFNYDNPDHTPVSGRKVSLMNAEGKIIKSTTTNKLGTFIFTGVSMNDAHKIELDFNKEFTTQKISVELSNMQNENLGVSLVNNNKMNWQNTSALRVMDKLVDLRFTYKIAAKLISENGGKYEFYANKTVILLNDKNTVVKRTKTNPFGSFVFTEVRPGFTYLIGIEKSETDAGKKVSLHATNDDFLSPVDSAVTTRLVRRFSAENNNLFNALLVDEKQLRMDVKGKLYKENINNPLSDLKIVLLNEKMESIDTTTTDDFGNFIFRYVPYSSNFTITGFEKDQILEAINNILVYSSEDDMIKIVSLVKGRRFTYKPLNTEQSRLNDLYADDPWLPLLNGKSLGNAKKGETIIENILFEVDKFNLLPAAQKTLDKVALVMNANQKIKIELSAHTDAQGVDSYNQTLSDQRAKTAMDYVVAKGVDPSRIIGKGYGETRILNHCKNNVFCADDENAVNRRIEFKILAN